MKYRFFGPDVFLLLSLFFLSCNNFPRDTRDSFENAEIQGLKVGVAENPPYVEVQGDSIFGIEVDMIKDFARKKNLQVNFIEGSESDLIEKLEKAEIHLLIGGFEKKTLWKKKVALSAKYDKKHVFFIPKGENQLMWELEEFIYKTVRK